MYPNTIIDSKHEQQLLQALTTTIRDHKVSTTATQCSIDCSPYPCHLSRKGLTLVFQASSSSLLLYAIWYHRSPRRSAMEDDECAPSLRHRDLWGLSIWKRNQGPRYLVTSCGGGALSLDCPRTIGLNVCSDQSLYLRRDHH